MPLNSNNAIADFVRTVKLSLDPEARQRAEAERTQAETQTWRERLTPLEQRVTKLLSEIPPAIAKDGIAMASLQDQLKGRWRGKAPAGLIGTSMRKLGWRRLRPWLGESAEYVAKWYPPINTKE